MDICKFTYSVATLQVNANLHMSTSKLKVRKYKINLLFQIKLLKSLYINIFKALNFYTFLNTKKSSRRACRAVDFFSRMCTSKGCLRKILHSHFILFLLYISNFNNLYTINNLSTDFLNTISYRVKKNRFLTCSS